MISRLLMTVVCLLSCFLSRPSFAVEAVDSEAVDVVWEVKQSHQVNVEALERGWQVTTTGNDPFLVGDLASAWTPEHRVLTFEYFSPHRIPTPSLFLGPPISEATRIDLPAFSTAEGWYRYSADLVTHGGRDLKPEFRQIRLDLGQERGIVMRIRDVQLRKMSDSDRRANEEAAERERVKLEAASKIRAYRAATYPHRIESVRVTSDRVMIAGTLDASAPNASAVRLVEFPIEHSLSDDVNEACQFHAVNVSDHRFEVSIPRIEKNRDRLHSRFAIVPMAATAPLLSSKTFATEIEPLAKNVAVPPQPRHQKGLSGLSRRGPEADIRELGISAVTVNVVLNSFIKETPCQGCEAIPMDGPPVYFNPQAFAGVDDMMRMAKQNELVVSAIILIPNASGQANRSPLIHPDADGGVYAMPDLTTSRGGKVYGFVLDQIARRYNDPASELGCITNWIAHNEVDFHSVWTNMGPQPREIVTETYYRAMRLIHNTAKQYQPAARVFASLTHHWVVEDVGGGRQLAPREMVEHLQAYSRQEGDFAWGVAYHPYPQSLFADVAWRDTMISDNFDTPLITIQNLGVLPRFLDQPSMRDAQGKPRPILLSEQGFHTKNYSDEVQANQAASLLYAMDQVRRWPAIESFHYHRWIDHPDEGGLMLGLRTLPTDAERYGVRKRCWEVYRDIGTEREAEWRSRLPVAAPKPVGSDPLEQK